MTRTPGPSKRHSIAAAIAALALVLSACGNPETAVSEDTQASTEQIVIGQVMPLTGGLADMGTRMSRGAEIARQLANADPCIPTTEFVWNIVDAPDDEGARQAAERLVSDGAEIVFGTMGSSLSLAASSVVARAGGIYWELGGGSAKELTERGFDGIYRVSSTATGLGTDAVAFADESVLPLLGLDPTVTRIAWAGVNNSYGIDVMEGVREAAEELGIMVVAELPYPGDATDLTSVALKLKDANPDVLFLSNYTDDALVLARAMREAEVSPLAVIGTGAAHSDKSWIEGIGTDGNGYFTLGAVSEVNPDGLLPAAQERNADYLAAYRAEYGTEPGGMDRMGFDGAWTLFATICAAGSADREAVMEAAATIDLPERSLLNGDGVHFDETGQNERVTWPVSQWQGGELVPVAPADLAMGEGVQLPLPLWGER